MTKRLIVIFCFLFSLFILKSLGAPETRAANLSGNLLNNSGNISITVTVNFFKPGHIFVGSQSPTISPHAQLTVTCINPGCDGGGDNPQYSAEWSTPCQAPVAVNLNGSGGNYTFASDPDVHCKTTNSSITVINTTCSNTSVGHLDWVINGTNPNISVIKVYKAIGSSPDNDLSPVTLAPTATGTDLTLSSATWNVSVKAFPNVPDNDPDHSTSTQVQLVCGTGGVTLPTGLVASPACNNSTPRVDFTWTGASPGSFNYTVEVTSNGNDPGPTANWSVLGGYASVNASPQLTSNYATTTLPSNTAYWWHVKAVGGAPSGNYVSNSGSQFIMPSSCPGVSYTPATYPYDAVITCASSQDNGDFSNDYQDDYSFADPQRVKIQWNRATPTASISTESLDWGTDPQFNPGNYATISSLTVSLDNTKALKIINSPFTVGTTYYFRVNTKMNNNQTYTSFVRQFKAPTKCFDATLANNAIVLSGFTYCAGNAGIVSLSWVLKNTGLNNTSSTARFNVNPLAGSPANAQGLFQLSYTGIGGLSGTYVVWKDNSAVSNTLNLPSPSCGGVFFDNPSALKSSVQPCSAGNPSIAFSFMSNDALYQYSLEISSEPFTSDTGTNSHNTSGYKILPSPGQGVQQNFTWNISSQLTGGNANPPGGSNLYVPVDGKTYYWRVRAISGEYAGPYIYEDGSGGTTFPTGAAVGLIPCNPRYDYAISIVSNSLKNSSGTSTSFLNAGEAASVDITVTNVSSQFISTAPVLDGQHNHIFGYFYYNGGASPDCAVGTYQSTAPQDSSHNDMEIDVFGGKDAIVQPHRDSATNTIDSVAVPVQGSGYSTGAILTIQGGGGNGAAGVVNTDSAGHVISVTMTSVGSGYTSTPTGTIFGGIAPNASATVTMNFIADSTSNTFTAFAYWIPSCIVDGGTEKDWSNNKSNSISYSVAVNRFFETQGGDVGAAGKIDVGVNSANLGSQVSYITVPSGGSGYQSAPAVSFSSGNAKATAIVYGGQVKAVQITDGGTGYTPLPSSPPNVIFTGGGINNGPPTTGAVATATVSPGTPKFQADYMMAASFLGQNTGVNPGPNPKGFKLNSYSKAQVPGGVYSYLDSRYRAKALAGVANCGPNNNQNFGLNVFIYCNGSMTISAPTQLIGNFVYLIDGDLNINSDLTLPANGADTAVYIVNGNINVDTFVKNIHGIFIARGAFVDCVNSCLVNDASFTLNIRGAVYADGIGLVNQGQKTINLSRSFIGNNTNASSPTEVFVYEPKYLIKLPNLFTVSGVGWKEISP